MQPRAWKYKPKSTPRPEGTVVRVRIRGWSKDSDKQPTPMDVSDALEKLKGQEKGLAKEYTAQELALVSRKQRLNEAARVAQKARRGKLGKKEWQKRREARDKTEPVVCLHSWPTVARSMYDVPPHAHRSMQICCLEQSTARFL